MNNYSLFAIRYLLFIISLLFFSCDNQNENKNSPLTESQLKEHLMNANKIIVKDESKDIENYTTRHKLEMKQTGTGLRYMIYKNGDGAKAENGKTVTLKYSLWLLNGKLCYSADSIEPLQFVIGKEDIINGLRESTLLMRTGDKAKVIVPAHLGYGLMGDGNKVPARATLVFDLELLKVED